MCFAVYVATDVPCKTSEWDKHHPGFWLESVRDKDRVVAQHFSKPHIYYAGSSSGCGCGFFDEPFDDNDEEDVRQLELAWESIKDLVDWLQQVLKTTDSVELFVCWEGDQEREPLRRLEMHPDELRKQPLPLEECDWVLIRNQ